MYPQSSALRRLEEALKILEENPENLSPEEYGEYIRIFCRMIDVGAALAERYGLPGMDQASEEAMAELLAEEEQYTSQQPHRDNGWKYIPLTGIHFG